MNDNDLLKGIKPYEFNEYLRTHEGFEAVLILRCPNNNIRSVEEEEDINSFFKRFKSFHAKTYNLETLFELLELQREIIDSYSEAFVTYESKPALELIIKGRSLDV